MYCLRIVPNELPEPDNPHRVEDGGGARQEEEKVLVKYLYDLGSCTFCQMCVSACPHHAIHFTNKFEHAVYTRSKLVKQANYLPEKDPVEVWKAQQKAKEEAAAKAAEAKAAEAPKNETTEKN